MTNAPHADAAVLRRLLIIGADREDAYAFVGSHPDAKPGDQVAEDRPSRLVPDDMWPPREAFNTFFVGARAPDASLGWPRRDDRPPFDAVIVTRAALEAYGADEADVRAWSADLLNPDGGWLYIQPPRGV